LTYKQEQTLLSAGGASDSVPNSQVTVDTTAAKWFQDDLVLASNATISTFPMAILGSAAGGDYVTENLLGLGPNSTILNALKARGSIASRTWSFFWGLNGATTSSQMDGSLIFGGYDAAKTTGQSVTAPLRHVVGQNCPSGMAVTISDMLLNFPNGSSPSIFAAAGVGPLAACLEPEFPTLMTLPLDIWQTFNDLAGGDNIGRSFGINFYSELFAAAGMYVQLSGFNTDAT
jgi:hypothetical protein